MDRRREDIIDILTREFIGPDPIDMEGMIQDNGEEILSSDPPRIRYIAGVLFPQKCKPDSVIATDDNESVLVEEEGISSPEERYARIGKETIDDAEEMINLSNAYQQSAISLTASTVPTDRINVYVSAGVYKKHRFKDEKTGNEKVKYYRIPIEWNNNNNPVDLPSADNKTTKKEIFINETQKTNLVFVTTEGKAKRASAALFDTSRKTSQAIKSSVVYVGYEGEYIVAETENGYSIKVKTDEIPVQGKGAGGVQLISLRRGDRVAKAISAGNEAEFNGISLSNMKAVKRGGKGMAEKLAAEIMDAYNNQGGAFKRKEDMHRMAEANRAFAHFRF